MEDEQYMDECRWRHDYDDEYEMEGVNFTSDKNSVHLTFLRKRKSVTLTSI